MSEGKEISFRYLLWNFVSHWKFIIVLIVIGALLGGAYSFLRSESSTRESNENKQAIVFEDGATYKEIINEVNGMSSEDALRYFYDILDSSDIDNISMYNYYKSLYDSQQSKNSDLNYMKLKPYDAYMGRSLYYIKSNSEESIESVLAAYKTQLNDLRETYGSLLSYSTESYPSYLGANGILSEGDELLVSNPTATMTVTVYNDSSENCKSDLEMIDGFISRLHNELSFKIVNHEISKVVESVHKVQESSVLDMQKSNIDTLNALNNGRNNVFNIMSERAKAFVKYVDSDPNISINDLPIFPKDSGIKGNNENSVNYDDSVFKSSDNNVVNDRVSAKWIVFGAVGGFLIAVIVLAISYCVSNKIRYEDDYESTFKVPCFGLTSVGNKKRRIGVDRIIYNSKYKHIHILNGNDAPGYIAAQILLSATNSNINKIYGTSSSFVNKEIRGLMSRVSEILEEKGIELCVGQSIFSDAFEIDRIAHARCIVLFESTSCSKQNEVFKVIRTCAERDIKTLGYVITG